VSDHKIYIKIEQQKMGTSWHFWLNGKEITGRVHSFRLSAGVAEVTMCELTVYVDELNVVAPVPIPRDEGGV
jgi:hypothetical protein